MLKTLEAACLLALLALAAPAAAQVGPSAPAPDDTDPEPGPMPDDGLEEIVESDDEDEGEKFPVGGSLSLSHSFAHSEFVESDQEWDSSGQFIGLDLGLNYSPVDEISISAGIGALKPVDLGYLSGGSGSSLSNYETELTDLNLGATWSPYTIPVADIEVGLVGGVRLPTGKASIAQGLIIGLNAGLSLSRSIADLKVSLSGGYTHNVWEDPTQQIDPRFVDLRRISGADLGQALPLTGLSTGLSLSYSIIEALSVTVAYRLSVRISSIVGPDDEYTSEYAQTGDQYSTGAHGVTGSVSYTLPFDTGTSIGLQMATNLKFYKIDGSGRVTNPFFETSSRQGAYTGYTLSLSQSL